MGTRSDIIVHRADGKWARIYCHWDGYLSHNGKILAEYYTSQKKAESLVALGDLSSLNNKIGRKHPFDRPPMFIGPEQKPNKEYKAFMKKYGDMCNFYGRDRGETNVDAKIGKTLAEVWPGADAWTEFTYVWDDGKWWVGDPDEGSQTLILLSDVLSGKKTIHPAIKVPFLGVIGQH